MKMVSFICAYCGESTAQPVGAVNRARKIGARLFCGKACAGLVRRKYKSPEQKREEKKLYDAARRITHRAEIKAAKAKAFKINYDPAKARVERKKRAHVHAEYCRRPEYREWKRTYDAGRRDKAFGEYAECNRLLIELMAEINSQMPRYERYKLNGRYERLRQRRTDNA